MISIMLTMAGAFLIMLELVAIMIAGVLVISIGIGTIGVLAMIISWLIERIKE